MSEWKSTWPTKAEYDRATKNWNDNVRDVDLIDTPPLPMMGTMPMHYEGAGLYVLVYKTGEWQTRCFCSNVNEQINPPADIIERYQAISRHVSVSLPRVRALVQTMLVPEGIYVAGAWRPVVKMEWISNALRLGSFVKAHHKDTELMRSLANEWRLMMLKLEQAEIAHGDLDVTNVLVQRQPSHERPRLRLIDYDNMWVSALRGRSQTECGHEPFQHPQFFRPRAAPNPIHRPFDIGMDRFSALVIYISLVAISEHPGLYTELQAREDERLLFSRDDYEQPSSKSGNIERVRQVCGDEIGPYIRELKACLEEERMPYSLREIADHSHTHAVPGPTAPAGPLPPPMTRPLGNKVPRTDESPDQGTMLIRRPRREQHTEPVEQHTELLREAGQQPPQLPQPLEPSTVHAHHSSKARPTASAVIVLVVVVLIVLVILLIVFVFHLHA